MSAQLRLSSLKRGHQAIITTLHLTGTGRRRVMDLGFLPGTPITIEMISPLGDPIAYRVRGSVIALRREQAQEIEVRLVDESEQTS